MSFASERERGVDGKFVKPSVPSGFDVKEYRKQRYLENRLEIIRRSVEWGRKNKEKRKVARDKWRSKNKERTNFLKRRYIYLKKHAKGSHTLEELKELYNIFPICLYCGVNLSNTIDHMHPLSKGGTNDLGNLIPVCVSCNSRKGAKTLWEFNGMLAYQFDRLHE